MPKFTKGEWKACGIEEVGSLSFIPIECGEKLIADVWLEHDDFPKTNPEEGRANAKLIIAASDMYKACKRALPILSALVTEKKLSPEECGYETSGYETLLLLKNAILKAEGREE